MIKEKKDILSLLQSVHDKNRIAALGDGIFAIIMTLQILDLKFPVLDKQQSLAHFLYNMWPHFATYVITFLLLGIYWQGWRALMVVIKYSNHIFNWLGILFFCIVTVLPFSESLIGNYPKRPAAILFFLANIWLVGIIMIILFFYINKERKDLGVDPIDRTFKRLAISQCFFFPLMFSIGAILFFITQVSVILFGIFLITPLLYIVPSWWSRIDRMICFFLPKRLQA